MTMPLWTSKRARARNASIEMAERALDAAAIPATIAGGATFTLVILARLPHIGGLFALAQALLVLAAYPTAGFLATVALQRFYHGPTRTLQAVHFGLGAALAITAGLLLGRLLGGLLLIVGNRSGDSHGFIAGVTAIATLVGRSLGDAIPQLLTGILLAVLGGFVAFDRDQLGDDIDRFAPKW